MDENFVVFIEIEELLKVVFSLNNDSNKNRYNFAMFGVSVGNKYVFFV